MAKNRLTGRTGKMYFDDGGGGSGTPSFEQITVVRNIQTPPVSRSRIDVTGMEDTAVESRPGIEEESEFSWEQQWDPNDTVDAKIRAAYEAASYDQFKAEFTDGTVTLTITWNGYITGIEPIAVDGNSPVAVRVTGVLRGSITEAVA